MNRKQINRRIFPSLLYSDALKYTATLCPDINILFFNLLLWIVFEPEIEVVVTALFLNSGFVFVTVFLIAGLTFVNLFTFFSSDLR